MGQLRKLHREPGNTQHRRVVVIIQPSASHYPKESEIHMRRSSPVSVCNMAKTRSGKGYSKTYGAGAKVLAKSVLALHRNNMAKKMAQRLNFKKASSKTKTKTKSSTNKRGRVSVEGGFQNGFAQYGRKKKSPKVVHATTPPFFTSYQVTQRMVNTVGKQSYDGVTGTMFSPNDIYTLQGAAAQTNNTYLKSYKQVAIGTNATNIGQYLTVYNLVAKRDIKYDATSDPGNVWLEGDAETTATIGPFYYGSSPFTTKRFNDYFRCWKVTEYKLGAGDTFKHTTIINANRMFSGTRITELTGITTAPAVRQGGFAGITQYTLFVQRPCPAHDSTTKTAATVTVPIANIDIIFTNQLCGFDVMEAKSTQKFQIQGIATSFPVGPQQEVDDIDALAPIVS